MDLAQSEDVVSKLFQISKDANIRKEVKPAILENNFFFLLRYLEFLYFPKKQLINV